MEYIGALMAPWEITCRRRGSENVGMSKSEIKESSNDREGNQIKK